MRTTLAELHTPGQPSKWFLVNLPTYGEPDFYRMISSFQWFIDREMKRAYPDAGSGNLIKGLNWMQYAQKILYCSQHHLYDPVDQYLDRIGIDPDKVEICDNVWKFYEKIGYDRAKKRYKQQIVQPQAQ